MTAATVGRTLPRSRSGWPASPRSRSVPSSTSRATPAPHVPLGLAIAPASVIGVMLAAGPCAATGRLGSPRGAVAATIGLGAVEVLGFVAFVVGARHSVPVTAVCSSQYATIAVIVSVLFLHERPTRLQFLGYGLIIAGVAVVSIAP